MDLNVVPSGGVDLQMMRDLGELCDRLREADIPVLPSPALIPGVKDAGLTVAIEAAGVAAAALSAFISALTYWSSQKPRYTLVVERGDVKLEAAQLDKAGVQALLQALRKEDEKCPVCVRVKVQ